MVQQVWPLGLGHLLGEGGGHGLMDGWMDRQVGRQPFISERFVLFPRLLVWEEKRYGMRG